MLDILDLKMSAVFFVLLGLYGADGSLASEVLKMHGVTRELIEEAIKEKSKMPKDRKKNGNGYSEDRIPVRNCRRTCNEIRV